MFDEILVLVSCWKKTYANHMLYRIISWNVFEILGLFCLKQHIRDWQETWGERGGVGRHATKASGRLRLWTLQLQEIRPLTSGATGHTRWNVFETMVSRHEHHLLSSHLSPYLPWDLIVQFISYCVFFFFPFVFNFDLWSNQLKKIKNEVKINWCKCTKFDQA